MNVRSTGAGAEVTYFEDSKRLITVRARKVIIACSKQVANVLLDKKIPSPGYDVYALRERVPVSERREIEDRGFCKLYLTPANIIGMRMTRFGHGMTLAKQGQIASGVLEKAHQTIDNAIYFAHSDNWANPCLETAFYSAMKIK